MCLCAADVCKNPQRPEECLRSPGTGAARGCVALHGWWDLSPPALQGQSKLSTAEPCLQPLIVAFP